MSFDFKILEKNMKKIEKDKPFSDLINITHIEPLPVHYSNISSMNAFKIKDSHGKFYKLRVESTSDIAERRERIIKAVSYFLPLFYGRDRKYLLFEFLQGRELVTENESLDIFFKIGTMYGEINKLKYDGSKEEMEDKMCRKIKFIFEKKIISVEDYTIVSTIYDELRRTIEYDIVLDVVDFSRSNFMIVSSNKVYLVDDNAIRYTIKGYGLIPQRLPCVNEEQRKALLDGYKSVNSIDFLQKDYQKLLTFKYCLDKIHFRSIAQRDYHEELKILYEFINSVKAK